MASPKSALAVGRIDTILVRLAAGGGVRFTVLRQALAPITARTLQMLLGRLVEVGWVERDPRTRLYHLGAGMIALAQRVVAGSGQERVAALVAALADATGCSAAWFVLRDDDQSVLSAKHEVAGGHQYTPVGGLKGDFVRHGFGQAILAVLPAAQRRRLLAASRQRPALAPAAFAARLELVRRQGWLLERDEGDPDVTRLAAPVQHPNGMVSAIGITSARLSEARVALVAGQVVQAARRLVALGAIAAACSSTAPEEP
jgi:IclR family KDG regulon transcriptional repressor